MYDQSMGKIKTSKQLERHFKGIANHRRIDILLLVKDCDGITLEEMAGRLKCNFKTLSEHTRRLVQAGLLDKKYQGRLVFHSLSPYGQKLVKFITTFQHSAECWNVSNDYFEGRTLQNVLIISGRFCLCG